ncbi:hypothetical protein CBW65_01455 [Tumebacillus avium]|uniref:Uncharacterized protein n=1 Tax=Tumebacillus avium TaxID=1903704 RepID=A0A1Y0IIH0_9BACL|nr:ATP-binding protein [Tumebacillus avium]ARU59869.1 hypothetical protein CBW65_01455 [Tumebacillus avium]
MRSLQVLQKHFPARVESEKRIIRDVFVIPSDFKSIISPNEGTIRILVGNKGTGKSTILEYLLQVSRENGIPAVKLKPSQILESSFSPNDPIAIIKQRLYQSLVLQIAATVGEELSGYVSQNEAALLEVAYEAGKVPLGTMRKLLNFLAPIGKGITRIDFEKMLPTYSKKSEEYVRLVNSYLERQDKTFYVLIDDTDQIGNPAQSNYLDILWGFVLAIQNLAEDCPNIKPIVTFRSEVWRSLEKDESGARDQVDHFRQMTYELSPTVKDLKDILKRRIVYCVEELNGDLQYPYRNFFEGDGCKLPTSGERRRWEDYLVISSRFRPRDTVQLVYHLATEAIRHSKTHIDDFDVDATSLIYSTERFKDIINENMKVCAELDIIIREFRKLPFESNAEDIREFISRIPGAGRITINGKLIRDGDSEGVFVIWKLLYDIEFFTPKLGDEDNYKHFRPKDDPYLVSISRWNDMQKYTWEVHPCYRSYLIEEQKKDYFAKQVKSNKSSKRKNRRG